MLSDSPFHVDILPSAIMDIVKMRMFYDGVEVGLGTAFRNHILSEIDKGPSAIAVKRCALSNLVLVDF